MALQAIWLEDVASRIPSDTRSKLVLHRGFHNKNDCISRPLENTLDAYETAWIAGFKLCECDIGVTTDGTLFLCHDDTLSRLSAQQCEESRIRVSELALRNLKRVTFKNGARCTTLDSVLRVARDSSPLDLDANKENMSDAGKLVVEIKHTPKETALALVDYLYKVPDLYKQVHIVMSFSLSGIRTYSQNHHLLHKETSVSHRPKTLLLTKTVQPAKDLWDRFILNICDSDACERLEEIVQEYGVDGAYIQYQDFMMTELGKQKIQTLVQKMYLGIWGAPEQHDRVEVAERLHEFGVDVVNSDLPKDFLQPYE